MPFYIRQRQISKTIGVYIVEAPDEEAARAMDIKGASYYSGYYTDDSEWNKPGEDFKPLAGPYTTMEEAEKRPEGWVEDL